MKLKRLFFPVWLELWKKRGEILEQENFKEKLCFIGETDRQTGWNILTKNPFVIPALFDGELLLLLDNQKDMIFPNNQSCTLAGM